MVGKLINTEWSTLEMTENLNTLVCSCVCSVVWSVHLCVFLSVCVHAHTCVYVHIVANALYMLQVHTGSGLACQLHGSLSNNFVHKYRVMAENEAGCGPYSPPLTVKTGDACKLYIVWPCTS